MTAVLFLTADDLRVPSGGAKVCHQEIQALTEMAGSYPEVWSRRELATGNDPWGWDDQAVLLAEEDRDFVPEFVHGYSGSFPRTIELFKNRGSKISWTIAAHDRYVSRREHEALGLEFPYPHLTEEPLWQKYIHGYSLADLIICPSTVAAATVRSYGPAFASKRIEVVPHGCDLPKAVAPPPVRFTVGYMGSFGADKGVRYLLEAWKQLAYRDATLVLAGRDSTSDWARHLIAVYGGGNIECRGWVNDVSDFYDQISLYVQPSATEGFGIEVAEAMAHGRPVICSRGAGAVDAVHFGWDVPACDVGLLAASIENARRELEWKLVKLEEWRASAAVYAWDKIREQYRQVWRTL